MSLLTTSILTLIAQIKKILNLKKIHNNKNNKYFFKKLHKNFFKTFWINFEKKQINAFYILLNNNEDLIFIVKTKFKKNILFQTISLIYLTFKTVLIIMLFIIFQNKQYKK